MLRIFQHYRKELILAGCVVVGAGSLHHMSGAVELMALEKIGPPLLFVLNGVVGVQVSVLILSIGDNVDELICGFFHLAKSLSWKTIP